MESPAPRTHSSVLVRTALWAAAYVALLYLGRLVVLEPYSIGLVVPSVGVGLVWLATARSLRQLLVDLVVLLVLTAAVLALTGGTGSQILLLVVNPVQYLVTIWLMQRLVPGIWGTGGRVPFTTLGQFGRLLVAMAAGAAFHAVVRTALGVLVIEAEVPGLVFGRFGRSVASMATESIVLLLVGGWACQRRDRGLPLLARPGPKDAWNAVSIAATTAAVLGLAFVVRPEAPTTYLLTLVVVWTALRFNPVVTSVYCLLVGAAVVWLTILGIGPIANADVAFVEARALLAQMLVVVLMVTGTVISISRRQVLDTVATLERAQVANVRRANELDLVMAHLDDAVAIIEQGGRIVHANAALRTAFGTQAAQELDRVRDDAELSEDERLVRAADGAALTDEISPLARALAGETVAPEEWRPARAEGPIRFVSIAAVPLPPEEGGVPRAMVVMRDISREKAHQDAIETRVAELDLVIDKLDDGLAIVEEGGRYVHSNDALRMIMTGDADADTFVEQVPPPSAYHLFHPDGRSVGDDEYPSMRAMEGVAVEAEEYHLRRPGAPSKILHMSAYPLRVEQGSRRRAMVVVRDVTVERSYQDSLASFAGTVAHDLNNPLSVIDGWAEAIEEDLRVSTDPTAVRAGAMMQHVRGSVGQMRAFITDLLAHAVARDQSLRCEPVQLRTMVKHIAAARDQPGLRRGEIVAEDLPDVWGDRLLVRQVLDNLIGNALKYVAPGVAPHVVVGSRPHHEGWVEVSVQDNGIGIEPAQRDRVFDSFHRVGQEQYAGTGLGLAISKRIVERHGGTIRVEGNDAGGSTFVLTLPTTPQAFRAATGA